MENLEEQKSATTKTLKFLKSSRLMNTIEIKKKIEFCFIFKKQFYNNYVSAAAGWGGKY